MASRSGVTVLGSANLDLTLGVTDLPTAGQTLLSTRRTGGPGAAGISCLLADADTPGLLPQAPERTMGLRAAAPARPGNISRARPTHFIF